MTEGQSGRQRLRKRCIEYERERQREKKER